MKNKQEETIDFNAIKLKLIELELKELSERKKFLEKEKAQIYEKIQTILLYE